MPVPDPVAPALLDKGHLIPQQYVGNLRVFQLYEDSLHPDRVTAHGAVFTDGRLVLATVDGELAERHRSLDAYYAHRRTAPHGAAIVWGVPGPHRDDWPRRFVLDRHRDRTGTSGTGVAVEGVVWPWGGVHLMWLGKVNSLVEWPSLGQVLGISGHDGDTTLRWLDPD